MKTKTIKMQKHVGEVGTENNYTHFFSGREITECKGNENITYKVDIHLIQEETNSTLRVQKEFETAETALDYLNKFLIINPICEAIIVEQSKKEIYHYV